MQLGSGDCIDMKTPTRFLFTLCLVSMFSMTLLFADNSISSASMTVEAYKEIPTPEGVFNIQVSFLDEVGSKTSVSGIGRTFDVSSRGLSSLSKVFVVTIRSNYGDRVTFSFRFSPFVNQINKSKTLPATYKISSESQNWNEVYSDGYYRFISEFSPDITSMVIPETGESDSISVSFSIRGEKWNWNTYSYDDFSFGPGIISELGNSFMETNIYGSLLVDKTGIEPNVDYVSTVVISLEVK